jgi:hypothetical protein
VNLDRLYDDADPAYVTWLMALITRVSDSRKAMADAQAREMT